MPFPHTKLREGEVRLLTIPPSAFGSELACSLCVARLQDRPSYEALSYCWGDSRRNHHIRIDEASFAVTDSVYEALQYLRLEDQPSHVWIDHIRIEQTNVHEKNLQVQQMGTEYQHADRTRA